MKESLRRKEVCGIRRNWDRTRHKTERDKEKKETRPDEKEMEEEK